MIKVARMYDLSNTATGDPIVLHMTSQDVSNGGIALKLNVRGENKIAFLDPDGNLSLGGAVIEYDYENLG